MQQNCSGVRSFLVPYSTLANEAATKSKRAPEQPQSSCRDSYPIPRISRGRLQSCEPPLSFVRALSEVQRCAATATHYSWPPAPQAGPH